MGSVESPLPERTRLDVRGTSRATRSAIRVHAQRASTPRAAARGAAINVERGVRPCDRRPANQLFSFVVPPSSFPVRVHAEAAGTDWPPGLSAIIPGPCELRSAVRVKRKRRIAGVDGRDRSRDATRIADRRKCFYMRGRHFGDTASRRAERSVGPMFFLFPLRARPIRGIVLSRTTAQ